MKNILIAMGLMAFLMIGGSGYISAIITFLAGGGIEQSYIYPIYGGIIVLTGVVVGVAQWVVEEIKILKEMLEDENKKSNQ